MREERLHVVVIGGEGNLVNAHRVKAVGNRLDSLIEEVPRVCLDCNVHGNASVWRRFTLFPTAAPLLT